MGRWSCSRRRWPLGSTTVVWLSLLAPPMVPGHSSSQTPLQYPDALAKADFPSPAVRLTLGGRAAWFLLDTGAGLHALASWFVEAAGLEANAGLATEIRGLDATGKQMRLRELPELSANLDGGAVLTLWPAVVAEFPPEFEKAEVGGVISPQLLAGPGRAAALDLRVPDLRLEPFSEALKRLGARPVPREQRRLCGRADDPIPNLVFAILVATGAEQNFLVLDTGATATKLAATSALARGRRLRPGGQTVGLSGEPEVYSISRRHRLEFAGYRAKVNARVVTAPPDPCGAEGLLGLDVLRRCAMVLGKNEIGIRCDP